MKPASTWPRLDVRAHETTIGEITVRLHPSVLLVGRAMTATPDDGAEAYASACEALARELENAAHALYQRATGIRQGVKP